MQDPKKSPKIAIWAPSHNFFVGLYLRNQGMYRQSEKKLVKQQYLLVLLRFQNVSCRSVSVGFAEKTSVFGSV